MLHSRGFTLIELVVVLVIIGMVMLLIPRLPSSEAEDLETSARTLASTLRYRARLPADGAEQLLSGGMQQRRHDMGQNLGYSIQFEFQSPIWFVCNQIISTWRSKI